MYCCTQGFYATTGWDPVTGLGSINYAKMETAFLPLGSTNTLTTGPSLSPVVGSATPATAPTSSLTKAPTTAPPRVTSHCAIFIIAITRYSYRVTNDSTARVTSHCAFSIITITSHSNWVTNDSPAVPTISSILSIRGVI
jgi:hypothetical protein